MFTPVTIPNYVDSSYDKNNIITYITTKRSNPKTTTMKKQAYITTIDTVKTTKSSRDVRDNKITLKNEATIVTKTSATPDITTITTQKKINAQAAFEATWYEGSTGTYGYSGRTLISGYSVASNYFPQGTLIKIEGSGLDGIYRVDDKGSMSNNVIDFFYNYGEVPNNFRQMGRVSIVAYVYDQLNI
ncbi:MAG: hypothetical protein K2F81_06160 [Ruminococcus sp.]|nr:hypothetical protein [Ruminococcus sp.]